MKKSHLGFGVVEILVIVAALAILGLLGWRFFASSENQQQTTSSQTAGPEQQSAGTVTWSYDQEALDWKASSTPPACKDPFVFDVSPLDMSQATSVLYPGQTRGGHYKAHGGFAFDNNTDNNVTVVMPFDAYLVGGIRYIESGEVQYIFDFESECGIAIRFDHLATLSDKFAQLADRYLPEAKVDDTRGTRIEPTFIKSGEVVATAIGHTMPRLNVGMDFGVYDYRQRNQASEDSAFQEAHGSYSAQTYHGVCWFDMLPGDDAAIAWSLPSRDFSMGTASDYCN